MSDRHHEHPVLFKDVDVLGFLIKTMSLTSQVPGVCEDCVDRAIRMVLNLAIEYGRDSEEMHDLLRIFSTGMIAVQTGVIKGPMLPSTRAVEKFLEDVERAASEENGEEDGEDTPN